MNFNLFYTKNKLEFVTAFSISFCRALVLSLPFTHWVTQPLLALVTSIGVPPLRCPHTPCVTEDTPCVLLASRFALLLSQHRMTHVPQAPALVLQNRSQV